MKTILFVLLSGLALPGLSFLPSREAATASTHAPQAALTAVRTTALINGNSYFYFSAWVTYGSGSITASPGALVTVDVSASGPPASGATYQTSFTLSGATLSGGSNTIYATSSGGQTANNIQTFTMPSSGSVSWSGSFSEPNNDGSGAIGVQ